MFLPPYVPGCGCTRVDPTQPCSPLDTSGVNTKDKFRVKGGTVVTAAGSYPWQVRSLNKSVFHVEERAKKNRMNKVMSVYSNIILWCLRIIKMLNCPQCNVCFVYWILCMIDDKTEEKIL